MKFKKVFFLIVSLNTIISIHSIPKIESTIHAEKYHEPKPVPLKDEKHHYLIEFNNTPLNEKQHADWIEAIEKAVENTGEILVKELLIAPKEFKKISTDNSLWQKIQHNLEQLFYNIFYHFNSVHYPHRKNYPFFTRRNEQFGSMGVYAPDGVPPKRFKEVLREQLKKQGVDVSILIDGPVYADIDPEPGVPKKIVGIAFDYIALDDFKEGRLKSVYEQKLKQINLKSKYELMTTQDNTQKVRAEEGLKFINEVEPQLFWHQEIPTTGIRKGKTVFQEDPQTKIKKQIDPWKNNYPFIPHQFPLWQMAPKLGEGITIAIIDTGIAAFRLEEQSGNSLPVLKKNIDLSMQGDFTNKNYNLVSSHNLNVLDDLLLLIGPNLDRTKYPNSFISYLWLENECIKWIREYLENNKSTKEIESYLRKHAFQGLFEQKGWSKDGKTLMTRIENELEKFHLVEIIDEKTNQKIKAILELMPTAPIQPKNMKNISHGSHVAGIAAGRIQNDIIEKTNYMPIQDEGICGIAPKANVIMIKTFTDDGMAPNQSTIIAALIRALMNGSHIVNMSLKMSDSINQTGGFSKTLTNLINLIPYCIASSGNDGDPNKPGYAGSPVEAVPARLENVAFDIGAFAFDYNTHTCPIAQFSQYQLDSNKSSIGPKFVAPGYNILSCGLMADQKFDSIATMQSGTSMAAPIISGFVALMLSEFKDDGEFSRNQLLKVCYKSGIKMMNHEDWKQKSIFGSLDMRTALFTLWVLRAFKTSSEKASDLFQQKFDFLLETIQTILFGMANEHVGVENLFENNFCSYYKETQEREKKNIKADLSAIHFKDFNAAVNFIKQCLLFITGLESIQPQGLSHQLLEKAKKIYNQSEINLFKGISAGAQNKINLVFSSKKKTKQIEKETSDYLGTLDVERLENIPVLKQNYWQKQASLLGGV